MSATIRRGWPVAVAGAAVLALSACGSSGRRADESGPAAPILLSAAVTPERVMIAPGTTGAGPVTLLVANLTGRSQQVTFESAGPAGAATPGMTQSTPPIGPRGTATLKAQLKPGRYEMSVAGDEVEPATVLVGAPRPSSSDDLDLP